MLVCNIHALNVVLFILSDYHYAVVPLSGAAVPPSAGQQSLSA